MIDNWFWVFIEYMESLFDCFFVIIWSSASLASVKKSFYEFVLFAVEVQNGFQIDPFSHNFLPYVHVLLSAWETVKQVSASVIISFDFLLD